MSRELRSTGKSGIGMTNSKVHFEDDTKRWKHDGEL